MKPRPFLDRVEASLRLPVSNQGIWEVILELDAAGPWSPGQVQRRTNLNKGTPRKLIRALLAGGYLKASGFETTKGKNPQAAPLYRLNSRPIMVPRLHSDGSEMPERGIEGLWRAMKMLKVFTSIELAEGTGQRINTADNYCRVLARAGVLASSVLPSRRIQYRLVVNVGALAPKILATRVVFDPNTKTIIGEADTAEVSP